MCNFVHTKPLKMMKQRIVIIGSGNVATALAVAAASKCDIVQIYSRTLTHAQQLAQRVHCPLATNRLDRLEKDADIYIIAVSDDAIAQIVLQVPDNGALWIHTSGSKPIGLFSGKRKCFGVMWLMQSFSKQLSVDFVEVPLFIEASSPEAHKALHRFASTLSHTVMEADSHRRARLHLASVFACNFSNHMYTLAQEVLDEDGLPFDVLKPLIRTTVEKLQNLSPTESQTGPAARADHQVMERQASMLTGDKQAIYHLISQSIMARHHTDK